MLWKTWNPWVYFLIPCTKHKKVLWELWDRTRKNFSNWAHGHIQMHDPKQKGWLLHLESNWCIDKQWTCMAHHNLYLGKDTTLLPIIYYVIFHEGFYKMEIFLVFLNGSHENAKLWILPFCRFYLYYPIFPLVLKPFKGKTFIEKTFQWYIKFFN